MRHSLASFLLLSIASTSTAAVLPALEARQATCSVTSGNPPAASTKLPDPFLKNDGTRITTKAEWPCRQQEISTLFQQTELGTKPGKPTTVTATLSGNTLSITCADSGKSISFSVSITYPSSGTAPFPAIIAYGGASIPIPAGVATITFNNDDIAAQASTSSRGQGKFYTLYGASHSAGALMAWAWGVSRILDGLEATAATNRIDAKRVGVTGCSRNGKGAFVAGAFEPRIALTLPQESGAGGAACWRISDIEKAKGKNIQTASQIVTENVWFSPAFNSYSSRVSSLPVDHHELAGLVSPRGLFVIENDIDWLGPVSTTGCMKVGRLIYGAVGVPDAMGFSLVGGHNHCQFPSAQSTQLNAFINKYLQNGSSSTANIEQSSVSVNAADYFTWTVPTLT